MPRKRRARHGHRYPPRARWQGLLPSRLPPSSRLRGRRVVAPPRGRVPAEAAGETDPRRRDHGWARRGCHRRDLVALAPPGGPTRRRLHPFPVRKAAGVGALLLVRGGRFLLLGRNEPLVAAPSRSFLRP